MNISNNKGTAALDIEKLLTALCTASGLIHCDKPTPLALVYCVVKLAS